MQISCQTSQDTYHQTAKQHTYTPTPTHNRTKVIPTMDAMRAMRALCQSATRPISIINRLCFHCASFENFRRRTKQKDENGKKWKKRSAVDGSSCDDRNVNRSCVCLSICCARQILFFSSVIIFCHIRLLLFGRLCRVQCRAAIMLTHFRLRSSAAATWRRWNNKESHGLMTSARNQRCCPRS